MNESYAFPKHKRCMSCKCLVKLNKHKRKITPLLCDVWNYKSIYLNYYNICKMCKHHLPNHPQKIIGPQLHTIGSGSVGTMSSQLPPPRKMAINISSRKPRDVLGLGQRSVPVLPSHLITAWTRSVKRLRYNKNTQYESSCNSCKSDIPYVCESGLWFWLMGPPFTWANFSYVFAQFVFNKSKLQDTLLCMKCFVWGRP